jgi:hypothetical protein
VHKTLVDTKAMIGSTFIVKATSVGCAILKIFILTKLWESSLNKICSTRLFLLLLLFVFVIRLLSSFHLGNISHPYFITWHKYPKTLTMKFGVLKFNVLVATN